MKKTQVQKKTLSTGRNLFAITLATLKFKNIFRNNAINNNLLDRFGGN